MKKYDYDIQCKDCGYRREAFHGWVFINKCYTPGEPNMLHNWTEVEKEHTGK